MKTTFIYCAVAAATAISITACGSGSDVADLGIGGSGVTSPSAFVSSGTISAIGSIFVNGVEYDTSSATFDIDGDPDGVEADLAIGMRVKVTGSVNADGITGNAESVAYDDELQGPVNEVSAPDIDGVNRSFKVFDTTVLINSTTTNFDVSPDITTTEPFDFSTIADKDHVEISGYYDSAGVLRATRVELESQAFNPGNDVIEIKGTITDLNNDRFSLSNISALTIDGSAAVLDDVPDNQLTNGLFVEVKGRCTDATCTELTASIIEAESGDFNEDDEVELEGIITAYVDDSSFRVNGFPVDASSATKEPLTMLLENDLLVEVEGTIINGTLVATSVKQEGGDIIVAALVASVEASANSFALEPVPGQSVTVNIDTSTEIEDEINETIENPAELLAALAPGDYLTIKGYDDGAGIVVANSVKLDEADKIVLQGVASDCSGDSASGSVTVLGISFPYDDSTSFEDQNEGAYADAVAFCAALTADSTIVKIVDESSDGVADEIEIEE